MSIRMEGEVVPRFDHVVFDYLRLIGEASAAKDDTAYLNLVETLENILLPLAGVGEWKNLIKLHEVEVKLKELVLSESAKKLKGAVHDSIKRGIERDKKQALHLVEMELARIRLRLITTILRKTNIIQFKQGEAYSLEDKALIAKRLFVGLSSLGFRVSSEEKIMEVLE